MSLRWSLWYLKRRLLAPRVKEQIQQQTEDLIIIVAKLLRHLKTPLGRSAVLRSKTFSGVLKHGLGNTYIWKYVPVNDNSTDWQSPSFPSKI